MRIDFRGKLVDAAEVRAGFIGCGGHAFRNLLPVFQFAPVQLVATCDLSLDKAQAFAAKFGAVSAYSDYRQMLDKERLDCVFVCVSPDSTGRPAYPAIALNCLHAGLHVWMETPVGTCDEIESLSEQAGRSGRNVMVGLKQMFCPANEKAYRLMQEESFGGCGLALLQYPLYIPSAEELAHFRQGNSVRSVQTFLNLACHPVSLMVYLLGMPASISLRRSDSGAGVALFTFASGTVASIAFTHGSSKMAALERTTLISRRAEHIVVENNLRVTLHRGAPLEYGASPDFYAHDPAQTSACWEPEFTQGQLYNKGLFLQGYYGEINEFARAILEGRCPAKAHLGHALQVTRVFESLIHSQRGDVQLSPGQSSPALPAAV